MAVTTTPQDIYLAAYAKSTKNRPGQIASESGELLQLIIRIFRGIYAGAARINPTFFAETADVVFASPGWARPEASQLIYKIENVNAPSITAGTEIKVLPFDQRTIEPGLPSVYRFGQVFRPVSGSATVPPISPQSGTLRFFYSKRPSTPASVTATVDAMWVEDFNELPMLRVARYLAAKDGRADEVAALTAEITEWATMLIAFLEHETANEVRSHGHIARFNSPSLIPVMSLLAGGTTKGAIE